MNLKDWRKEKRLRQEDLAAKLGTVQGTYQGWENGRTLFPHDIQAKLRGLGYTGPWPHEVDPSPLFNPSDYITREEFLELRAAVKAHIEYWRDGEERVLRRLMEAFQRIEALEKRASE